MSKTTKHNKLQDGGSSHVCVQLIYACTVFGPIVGSNVNQQIPQQCWGFDASLLGYDSGSHSPPSTATTPPHMLEDNDMSGSSTGETTPPVIQVYI